MNILRIVLLVSLLLTACGGGDPEPEPEPTTCTVQQCTDPR